LVATPFRTLANFERKHLGLPEMPYAMLPYPISGIPIEEAQRRALAVLDTVVTGLTAYPGAAPEASVAPTVKGELATVVDLEDNSFDAINQTFYERRWTDGLPIVPPTWARVQAMLEYTDLPQDTVLGRMGPSWQPTTVHHAAVNAVMAGCQPRYFPVLVAGLQAMLDPALNIYGVQGTTNPTGVMLLVNGPIARELDINCGLNLFGQGWHANGTIGRASRLCMINIGGGRPGEGDMSTLGSPNKWGSCIAENEAQSPWAPFHVDRGFDASTSTVTAVATAAPQNVIEMAPETLAQLNTLAGALTSAGSNSTLFDMQPMVVLSPLQAKRIADGGYDKAATQKYLWEHARFEVTNYFPTSQRTIREWKASCLRVEDGREWIYPTRTPEDIGIVVAGGDSGPHSAILATFNGTNLITRPIAFADGRPAASVEAFRSE
jgi:hypothetical protein